LSPAFPACVAQPGGDGALGTDNQGHLAADVDGVRGRDDLQQRLDAGSLREYTLVGAISATFDGSADGGPEALRSPADCDANIAGAPASIRAPLSAAFQPRVARVTLDASGQQLLTAARLPALHTDVLQACADVDGLIADPRICVGPTGTRAATSALPVQAETVRKRSVGPVDAQGRRLYIGGEPSGSALAWALEIVRPAGIEPVSRALGERSLTYQAFQSPSFLKWRFTVSGCISLRPLGAFRAPGGRLIIWQGRADQVIPLSGSPIYYNAVQERIGRRQQMQTFARLFLFPGMYHYAGGYGPAQCDLVAPLVVRVEWELTADRIVAWQTANSGQVARTFPVFPYPEQTMYTGQGSRGDANNSIGVVPQLLPDDD
jgi:feruloyl esterase